jgi:NAD-dependent dihydropyrimidine dehydrogenase PreA subunit
MTYYIDPEKCQACMICYRNCPVNAVIGEKNHIHVIDQKKCIKCGSCYEMCPSRFSAVKKISGEPVPSPLPEDQRLIQRSKKEKQK